MHRIFIALYYLIERNRLVAALLALSFLIVGIFYASKIKFEEDISQMLPKNGKSDITAQVLSQLEFSDKIIVLINSRTNGDQLTETADAFIESLEPLSPYLKSVQGKVDEDQISETFDFAQKNIPLLLADDDYRIIEERISGDSINHRLAANYRALTAPTSLVTKEFIKKDPLGITGLGLQKLNLLGGNKDFRLQDGYIVSQDGKNILLFLEPAFGGAETKNNEVLAEKLNLLKDRLNKEFNGKTEISYFGAPLIAAANARQIKKDIQTTVLISTAVLLLLLIFYFRNILAPIIIFIPTVFGAAAGLIFIYIIKDSISAISLSVSAILIGITIDYAIHILTHYKHKNNIEDVLKEITHPIIMSASTTAVSFLCLTFVRSEALRDLGIFASVTVMFSALFTLVLIPHLYRPRKSNVPEKKTFIDKIGAYPYEKNRPLVIICSLLIVATFFGFSHIKFNQNISDLNFVPEEMKENEKKLEKLSDITEKSIHVVSYGSTSAEAVDKNTKLLSFLKNQQEGGKILSFQSVGEVVLSEKEQQERIRRWNSFWNPERKADVISQMKISGASQGFNSSAFSTFEEMLNRNYQPLSLDDYSNLPALQLSEFYGSEKGMHTLSTVVKVDEGQRAQFISDVEKNNEVLAIDRQQINENFLGLLKDDFNSLINYSLIAVILIFLIFFRNIDLTVMAVIPIILSGIVTAGILYFLGLELNIFSTIVCTLIFGAGVDFNIFLTQALQKEISTGKDQLPLYRVSIILALITTVLAVGALIFAKHPALHSVSTVALVGMVAVVVISFAMYPLMFGYIRQHSLKGLMPVTVRVLLNSVFSLLIYAFGGIIFGIIAPFFSGRNQGKLKKLVASYLTMVLHTNPFVRKRVVNQTGEMFEKPAVVIANHTSSLDTLSMAMTTHKLLFFVNDWVYNSPVFGRLVRCLGFFPVSEGLEGNIDRLKEKVAQGYSLMIFPEGERSTTNSIQRFHKGAFYLAENLKLDILPVYVHGTSEVMPKGDLFIHDGSITVITGRRIAWDDVSFGVTYQHRAKKINALFRETFSELRKELEDEDYFTKKILMNYHYMEKEIVKEVRTDWKQNKKLYHELNKWIGPKDHILHISADYGQRDMLLVLQEAGRQINSYNVDVEKRDTARQSYLLQRRKIQYSDTLDNLETVPDVLLISDVSFNLDQLAVLPPRIIFLNRPEVQAPAGYATAEAKDGLTVFNIMD
ncbi:MMPL family transporter [Chryseobacterium sp. cx-311]|uniref:MMPL family transporter n=1 Tax=Marnyiella aurantia TaxID=2758037 RepID=UPI001AE7C0A2|nr:MMPL family transporter [Marnyiella aurantia]MBP0613109.1 MMPL family transporter [Marnyiella aurantia]